MFKKFPWAAQKARDAQGSATDPTLHSLAESLEAISQGLEEQSQAVQDLLRRLS